MAHAKSGPWWETNGRRSLANNSAVYETKPDMGMFLHEWSSLYNSRSGERGICNRESMRALAERAGRDKNYAFGTNPCSEIILRPNQFCNLSTIAVRPDDQAPQLIDKIRYATILGTIQSALTDFKYFESRGQGEFKKNCEEERLLGVSMTGIFDNNLTNGGQGPQELQKLLEALHFVAHGTNKKWAKILNIAESKSITCIKPEGTTSCVAGTASGLHPRFSKFYIRRSQMPVTSPMTSFLKDAGVPWQPFFYNPENMVVFEFPVKADFGVTEDQINSIGHLNLWLSYQLWYCDHKPSVTVNYTDKDYLAIGSWLWTYWDYVSGVSFLPKDDNTYEHTPFEAITEEKYNELNSKMPETINWSLLSEYEKEDTTKTSHAMVCTADGCELT
jgi:ribonucleoside-diphosphate reductase alpha chain